MKKISHTYPNSTLSAYGWRRFFNFRKAFQLSFIVLLLMALFGVAISGAVQNLASAIEEFLSSETTIATSSFETPSITAGDLTEGDGIIRETAIWVGTKRLIKTMDSALVVLLDEEGQLWGWGANESGSLGIGSYADQSIPIRIPNPVGVDYWLTACLGNTFTLAIAQDGSLWTTGLNSQGQLGLGDNLNRNTFQKVPLPPTVTSWTEVYGGFTFAIARDQSGELWAWGQNTMGQLGIGTMVSTNTPQRVLKPQGVTRWVEVAPRGDRTLGVCQNGFLWAWGAGANGALGLGTNVNHHTPQQIPFPDGVTSWSMSVHSRNASFAFDQNGEPWVWGYNSLGSLGLGHTISYNSPQKSQYPPGVNYWIAKASTRESFIALDQAGNMWTWGEGSEQSLGHGATGGPGNRPLHESTPRMVENPDGVDSWQNVSGTAANYYAIDNHGRLWTWGRGTRGESAKGIISTSTNYQGEGTDNYRPWRLAPSLIPQSQSIWTPPVDATTPSHGAIDVKDDTVTIRFDREMNTEELGTIAVICAGNERIEANVSTGVWSSGTHLGAPGATIQNSVFTVTIPLVSSNSLHTVEVTGFKDVLFNAEMYPVGFDMSHDTPQYPYTPWSFTTSVLPQLVEAILPRGSNVAIELTTQLEIHFREPVDVAAGGKVVISNTTPNTPLAGIPYEMNELSYQWFENNTILVIVIPTYFELDYATRYDIAVSGFKNMDGGQIDVNDIRNKGWFITEPIEGDLVIRKTLQMPEGVTTPNTTFKFDVVPYGVIQTRDQDNHTIEYVNTSRAGELPTLNAAEIEFMDVLEGNTFQGVKSIQGTTVNLLNGIEWKASGQFVWKIKERSDTYEQALPGYQDMMHFDGREFELVVIVMALPAPSTEFHVAAIELRNPGAYTAGDKLELEELHYTNTLIRKHVPNDPLVNTGYKVTQQMEGDFGDPGLYFRHQVWVSAPQLITEATATASYYDANVKYRAYVVDTSTNTVVPNPVTTAFMVPGDYVGLMEFTAGKMDTVDLKAGQELVFVDMHVGARFNVVNQARAPYTHRATLHLAGQDVVGVLSAPENASLDIGGPHLVGEVENRADFIAYHRFILPTRLAAYAPRGIGYMVLVGVMMVLVVVSVRHRRRIERMPVLYGPLVM